MTKYSIKHKYFIRKNTSKSKKCRKRHEFCDLAGEAGLCVTQCGHEAPMGF